VFLKVGDFDGQGAIEGEKTPRGRKFSTTDRSLC